MNISMVWASPSHQARQEQPSQNTGVLVLIVCRSWFRCEKAKSSELFRAHRREGRGFVDPCPDGHREDPQPNKSYPLMGFAFSGPFSASNPHAGAPISVCFSLDCCRFRFGILPFIADFAFPSGVVGPVLNPPCSLHRPLPYNPSSLQGVPFLVRAPHVRPRSSSGKGGVGKRRGRVTTTRMVFGSR